MINDKALILCTDSYPYGYGEAFLESELPVISSYYHVVFILPDTIEEVRKREVPKNVVVVENQRTKIPLFFATKVVFNDLLIRKELFLNFFTNPLRNKVLLKTVQRALEKSAQIDCAYQQCENFKVHFYSYWMNHATIAACVLNKNGIKISRIHGWDIYEIRQKYNYLPLRPYLLKNLDEVHSISQSGINHLRKKFKNVPRLVLSRLGVEGMNENPNSKASFTEMISISNLIALKRVELIISAVTVGDFVKLNWNHFGTGPLLKNLINMTNNDIFKGQVTNDEIKKMLLEKSGDAFLINVSRYEGVPVSMMEAMSFGIPCIGTNVGGVSEIIEDGYNGFLLSANPSVNEIIEVIQRMLLLSGEEALKMRKAAYKTWEEKFNSKTNYKKFADELYSL